MRYCICAECRYRSYVYVGPYFALMMQIHVNRLRLLLLYAATLCLESDLGREFTKSPQQRVGVDCKLPCLARGAETLARACWDTYTHREGFLNSKWYSQQL
jgi:hypothetical protein